MSLTTVLSPEVLTEFTAAAGKAGLPIVDNLGSGLPAATVDAIVRQLGLTAPPELKALWAWAALLDDSGLSGLSAPACAISPDIELLTPDLAVERTTWIRGVIDAEYLFPRRWLAIGRLNGPHGLVYLDCSPTTGPSAVGAADFQAPGIEIVAPSLGTYFERCTAALSDELYGAADGELWRTDDVLSLLWDAED